jgi:hypothetical protein
MNLKDILQTLGEYFVESVASSRLHIFMLILNASAFAVIALKKLWK